MRSQRRDVISLLKFVAAPTAIESAPEGYVLTRGNRSRKANGPLVAGLVSRGALVRRGDCIQRTVAGEATLRRLLSASDGADSHAEQHRERATVTFTDSDGAPEVLTVNLAGNTIERLARQRIDGVPFLHPELAEAGRRLASDFERGLLRQRMTTDWGAIGGGGNGGPSAANARADLSDAAMGARQRFERACGALGPDLRGATVDVCCYGFGLEDIERRNNWPRRSGKMMLRAGLEQLAMHYREPHEKVR